MHESLNTEATQVDAELEARIHNEMVALLFRALPAGIISSVIAAAFLSLVLFQFSGDRLLFLWLAVIIIINTARFLLYKRYTKRKQNKPEVMFWDNSFYTFVMLNGLCFAVIGLWFLPDATSVYRYFPIMILFGLSAGGISSLSYRMRNITSYFILLNLPVVISEIMVGTFLSYSIAIVITLALFVSLVSAKRINKTAIENITLQFRSEKHNQELMKSEHVANEANSAKSQFISLISHELRTPLNAILGYTQLLKMSDNPALNNEQKEQTEGIVASGKYLISLIEELLDLSKIEANNVDLDLQAVNVLPCLEQALAIVGPVASAENITIINNIDHSYMVKADEKRLKQILVNLISNAIQYNKKAGRVILDAEISQDKYLKVSVTDDGNGLNRQQQERLFKPFQRFDNKKEGLGLGLYVVYRIVNLMGGNVGFNSEPDKGSTFWFELEVV